MSTQISSLTINPKVYAIAAMEAFLRSLNGTEPWIPTSKYLPAVNRGAV